MAGVFSHGRIRVYLEPIDGIAFFSALALLVAGLLTTFSFTGDSTLFSRQIISAIISLFVFFLFVGIDYRPLRKTWVVTSLYAVILFLLIGLLLFGSTVRGVQSWFSLFGFSFQPADFAKLILILVLAKYFSRRHVEIGHFLHVVVSGLYAAILFFLILIQPDFGSAIIIALIWFAMVLVSGMNKRHILLVVASAVLSFIILWTSVFAPYQKQRIISFLSPLADIQGSGYNAYQSTIAVGSGELVGKGVGFGTQSRLQFLPEYETDFIFAAFTEEWGFIGALLLMTLFLIIVWRVLSAAYYGASNFETLFSVGYVIFLLSHFTIHVGMNIGLLPVTGLTMPFMSYGGSHLLVEFIGLGIVMGMRRYRRVVHRNSYSNEFAGPG